MRTSYSQLDTIRDLSNEIIEYFQNPKKQNCYMAAIKGDLGSGKTLFARFLIDELAQNDDFLELMSPKNIIVSSLNSETQYNFLNIWKPILAQIITQHAKRDKQSREQILLLFL
jgi:tRNA A37 threonylcarbamoyladenosine biosynthesis protein TsaE